MKNNVKIIIAFILGLIIAGSIGVYAAIKIQADEIGYKEGTVNDALNDLYSKANTNKKTCLYVSGTKGQVASKYICDPGDGVARGFYILKVENNDVKMIAEKNITDSTNNATISYNDAIAFFNENHPGYATKQAWINVKNVDLPIIQDITDAGGITGWNYETATSDNWSYFGANSKQNSSQKGNYAWLYNYTIDCGSNGCSNSVSNNSNYSHGYWTKNLVQNDSSIAWRVAASGNIGWSSIDDSGDFGVRPVITIASSQLSN